MLRAIRLAALIAIPGMTLLVAWPAAAAIASGADRGPGPSVHAFSLTPVERALAVPRPPLPQAAAEDFKWFGYPSARAAELPSSGSRQIGSGLLFRHTALGVAMLDVPVDRMAVADADHGAFDTASLRLTVPPASEPAMPSPLPISLVVALVLLPVALVVGQALWGPSRQPHAALGRRTDPRRDAHR